MTMTINLDKTFQQYLAKINFKITKKVKKKSKNDETFRQKR